jgi:L-threonylcarbamoyladenylate synthase
VLQFQQESHESLTQAANVLRSGKAVIVPTDTVYGLAADVRSDAGVQAIYDLKGKGTQAPLQLLFGANDALLSEYAELNEPARLLLAALGPGPWTIIVPARPGWSSPALAGGATVGVRIPPVPLITELVGALGAPLAASSANRHGDASPTTFAAARDSLLAGGSQPAELAGGFDTGETARGLDSTVIDCVSQPPRLLREGAIDRREVARILGLPEIEVVRTVRQ